MRQPTRASACARDWRVGGAGEPGADKGAHEQRGMAATAFPPLNFKAAIARARTSCEVSLQ